MKGFDKLYAGVPVEQKDLLRTFRETHPYKTLDVGSGTWRYIASGQGAKTLLFLPGGGLTADMYFYPILALEDRYRIVVPDSYALQDTFDMDDVCRALVAILDAEGAAKAAVIGVSAGGGVAQYFIQEYPERIDSLVLSHCGPFDGPDEKAEVRVKRMTALVRLLPMFVIRAMIMRMTAGRPPEGSEWIAFHDAYFSERAPALNDKRQVLKFLAHGMQARRAFRYKPEIIERWPGETLIIASEDDQAAYQGLEKLKGRFPGARTFIFERGGHHTFMFFPEQYTAVLTGFLDGVLNGAR